jgi:hypothetical protein
VLINKTMDLSAGRGLISVGMLEDAGAPYNRSPHAGELVSRILHHRRGATSRRVVEVLELAGAGPPLCELAQRLRDERLPVFAP